ncbi:MAG: two-component regulator propeller domain-containing protein [Bacteroidales bacterium]
MRVLRYHTAVLFFVFLIFANQGNAQVRFERYTVNEGLSSNYVRCLFQDNRGFIWLGTKDGLNRFEGSEFVSYYTSETDSNSISHNTINVIQQYDSRRLIICTSGGVDFYDLMTDSFTHCSYFKNKIVLTLLKDTGGWYWVGTFNGLYYAHFGKNRYIDFSAVPYSSIGLRGKTFMCFYKDKRGRLWAGTDSGLNILDLSRMRNVVIKAGRASGLSSNYVQDIEADSEGNIWVGSSLGGLDYCLASDALKDIPQLRLYMKGSVMDIVHTQNGELWVGNGSSGGLYRILSPLNNPHIEHYLNESFNISSLSDNSIECIYQDKDGDIWVGTHTGGLNFFSYRFKKFYSIVFPAFDGRLSNNSVNAFAEDEKYFWIGTESGLNRIDKQTGKLKIFKSNGLNSLGANAVYALFVDSRKRLWVGTWAGGLNLYNYQTETFSVFRHDTANPYSLPSNHVFAIAEDSLHRLWIGTIRGGLSYYDEKNGRFVNYLYRPDVPQGIFSNSVCHIVPSAGGKLWLSTYFSADLFDPAKGVFKHYTRIKKGGGDLACIYFDSKHNTWFGSENGLAVIPAADTNVRFYNLDPHCKNIKAITEDHRGNLWLSTSQGIVKLVAAITLPDTPAFRLYHSHDGLQGEDFNVRAVFRKANGLIYFGGLNGFTWFHPDSIVDNPVPPRVFITKLLNYKNRLPIEKVPCCKDTVVLQPHQNYIIIEFSSLSYLSPKHNKYRYRLTGFEKEWHTVSQQTPAVYTNLPPGVFTFEVYGCNNDGIWSAEPTRLVLMVRPPWWKTTVFYIGLIIFVVAMVVGIFRIRVRNLKKIKKELEQLVAQRTEELLLANKQLEESQEEIIAQNNELEMHRHHLEQLVESRTRELQQALKKAEESDKLKSAFLANMSHEIRTPMNAILGFSTLIAEEMVPSDKRKEYVDIIQKNCDTLNVLINDILDLSMIESDQIKFIYTDVSINQLMSELERQFQIAKPERVEVVFVSKSAPEVRIRSDYVRLKQIMSNLLGNAIKFTEEGYVHFGFQVKSNHIEFFVKDTGIGIDPTQADKVFRPFGKINPSHVSTLYRGTGLGLSICKKLIELMGGSIWFESEVGKGTVFYFTLPYNTASKNTTELYVNPNDKVDLSNCVLVVAEDEADNFYFISEVLKSTGARILWAKDGEELMSLLETEQKPDIILMDIQMPKLNGIETLKHLRSRGYMLPVIAITAHAYRNEQIEIMKHSFDGYLAKPVSKNQLITLIAKYMSKK